MQIGRAKSPKICIEVTLLQAKGDAALSAAGLAPESQLTFGSRG